MNKCTHTYTQINDLEGHLSPTWWSDRQADRQAYSSPFYFKFVSDGAESADQISFFCIRLSRSQRSDQKKTDLTRLTIVLPRPWGGGGGWVFPLVMSECLAVPSAAVSFPQVLVFLYHGKMTRQQ